MKRKIVVSVLSVLLIISILAVSFAWFYINENTYVDFGSDIKCEAGESLEISDDGGVSWSGVINKTGFSSATIDITGDGKNFYKPVEINENAQPVGYNAASPVDENGYGEYVCIDLMFRSTTRLGVYLSEDSYIEPVDPQKEGNIFGKFSRDYIAGSTRVSFVHNDEVKMIWAPNPQYELVKENKGKYSFNENGVFETYRYTTYENSAYSVKEFSADDYAFSKFLPGSTESNGTNAGKSARLFTLEPPAEDQYDVEAVRVCIWFEGTDREASEALAGGTVKIKLKFTGIEKEENTAGENDINNIVSSDGVINNIKNGMSFSFDGIEWISYSGTNFPSDLSGFENVYFKYPETETSFATSVRKIPITSIT